MHWAVQTMKLLDCDKYIISVYICSYFISTSGDQVIYLTYNSGRCEYIVELCMGCLFL